MGSGSGAHQVSDLTGPELSETLLCAPVPVLASSSCDVWPRSDPCVGSSLGVKHKACRVIEMQSRPDKRLKFPAMLSTMTQESTQGSRLGVVRGVGFFGTGITQV